MKSSKSIIAASPPQRLGHGDAAALARPIDHGRASMKPCLRRIGAQQRPRRGDPRRPTPWRDHGAGAAVGGEPARRGLTRPRRRSISALAARRRPGAYAMHRLEAAVESLIFASRWLLAPFFLGLILAIVALLWKFAKQLWTLLQAVMSGGDADTVIAILSLVDTALIAGLLLIVTFSGYENFVSRIGDGRQEDRPAWMGKVGFVGLKLKLIGAIVAISAVELLKSFFLLEQLSDDQLMWRIGIHVTFVVSGVLFALTDYIAGHGAGQGANHGAGQGAGKP
jgi:uncharacterized protein (TIGR00645 family)